VPIPFHELCLVTRRFFLVIDLYLHETSASKRSQAEVIEITEAEIVSAVQISGNEVIAAPNVTNGNWDDKCDVLQGTFSTRMTTIRNVLAMMLQEAEPKTGQVFDATNLRQEWTDACSAAGLGRKIKVPGKKYDPRYEGLTLHDLRR
jgi:hypothetical protein